MKRLFQIIYFSAIGFYFLPVGEVISMAQDVVSPNFAVASTAQAGTCFNPHAYADGDYRTDIKTVFSIYGDAARSSSFCSS